MSSGEWGEERMGGRVGLLSTFSRGQRYVEGGVIGRDGGPLSGPAPRHVGTNDEPVANIAIDTPGRL